MTDVEEVVILGSGPAGLAAAVYAGRADLDPVVLEGDQPGGQLTLTTDVENYLGFPEGVGGMELVQRGREQAERFGADFQHAIVETIDGSSPPYTLGLSSGERLETKSLVVATGAYARTLGIPGEDELMGYGLSTCATCDGAFHRGDDVLVVGGGDSAMEEALFLSRFAESVTIVHRRDELRASDIMAKRAREHEDIDFEWNTELVEIHGSESDGVTGVTVVSHPDGHPTEQRESGTQLEKRHISAQGIFYGIGHVPNTDFLEDTGVELSDAGHIYTGYEGYETMTALDGVFAAGDVMDSTYRQAITAAGFGSMAALDVESWLEEHATASYEKRIATQ